MSISKKDMILLSAYLDGELKAVEAKKLEQRLAESPDLSTELEALKQLQQQIRSAATPEPAPFFENALQYRIEQEGTHSNFFSLHKTVLAYSGIAASILILIVLLVISNIKEDKTSDSFAALSGFSPISSSNNITNEDIFNFALYNRLPFNEKKSQYIELGSDEMGDEYIAITANDTTIPLNSLRNYYMAMGLDEEQIRQFDSILGIYAEMIRQKALFQKENKIALNTNLWNLNSALTTDLILFSVNANEGQFEKFVPTYATSSNSIDMMKKEVHIDHNDPFLILTIDTLVIRPFEINVSVVNAGIDTIEKSMLHLKRHLKKSLVALNDSLINNGKNEMVFQRNFTITNDSNYIFIKFLTNNIEAENIVEAEAVKNQLKDLRRQMKFLNIDLNIDSAMFLVDSNTSSVKVPFYTLSLDTIKTTKAGIEEARKPNAPARKDTQVNLKKDPFDIKKGQPQALKRS